MKCIASSRTSWSGKRQTMHEIYAANLCEFDPAICNCDSNAKNDTPICARNHDAGRPRPLWHLVRREHCTCPHRHRTDALCRRAAGVQPASGACRQPPAVCAVGPELLPVITEQASERRPPHRLRVRGLPITRTALRMAAFAFGLGIALPTLAQTITGSSLDITGQSTLHRMSPCVLGALGWMYAATAPQVM